MWVMTRARVFSAVYGGICRVKWHHLGVVGSVLGKEMGKDFLALTGVYSFLAEYRSLFPSSQRGRPSLPPTVADERVNAVTSR